MDIIVNGKSVEFGGSTFTDLLRQLGIQEGGIAVERNGTLLHMESLSSEKVSQGDLIEIVKFVGGG